MSAIDAILEKRKQQEKPGTDAEAKQEDKFYSILVGEGSEENFLEIRTKDGLCTCFPYSAVTWMVYDPENGIFMDFAGYLVTIEGRGLQPKLMQGLKQRRVGWIKEADTVMQDHVSNETFIEKITITPPKDFAEEETAP